jgi:hypothetical protein
MTPLAPQLLPPNDGRGFCGSRIVSDCVAQEVRTDAGRPTHPAARVAPLTHD